MLGAEVHHFLRFLHAADRRARQGFAPHDQVGAGNGIQRSQRAHQRHGAVQRQQRHVGIHVVADGNRVQQEVEAAGVRRHCLGVARDQHFVGAQALGVAALVG
ncbi:hypothetical protein D3C87_1301590 [compost metagenome]